MASSVGDLVATLGLNNRPFKAGLTGASGMLTSFASQAKAMIGSVAGMFGVMLGAAGAVMGFRKLITDASALQEVMNKFDVVFGANRDSMKQWSDNFGEQLGRSKRQVAQFLSGAQDLFVPLGFGADEAMRMSKQVAGLAMDLASFNDLADADVMRDLLVAMTGSGEVMKKYGVIVSEAAVKQELMSQGMSKGQANAASDVAKVQARLNIILRGTTAAQGDVERSAGSYANTMKALWAKIEDVSAAIGTKLLPAITSVAQGFIYVLDYLGPLVTFAVIGFKSIQLAVMWVVKEIAVFLALITGSDATKAFAESMVGSISGLATEIETLVISIDDIDVASQGAAEGIGGMNDALSAMPDTAKAAKSALDTLAGVQSDILAFGEPGWFKAAMGMAGELGADNPLVAAFVAANQELDTMKEKADTAAKDKSLGMSVIEANRTPLEQLKKELDDLSRLRSVGALGEGYAGQTTYSRAAKAAQDKYVAAVKQGDIEDVFVTPPEPPGILERGSNEAWKKIIGQMYGTDKDKAADKTAKSTARTAEILARIENREVEEVGID